MGRHGIGYVSSSVKFLVLKMGGMMMAKRKRTVIISVILFIISIGWIFVAFFVPRITNTESFTYDNTFKHRATVKYVEVNNDAFEIHIQENDQTLGIGMGALKGKTKLLNGINTGDTIVFWTYWVDSYNLPDVDRVSICAFSINNKPILTIEERNRMEQKSLTIVRIMTIGLAIVLVSIGVFLLIRAYRKPKDKINQNSQT